MKRSELSIFELDRPSIWRVIGANVLLWVLAGGFWWKVLGITSVDTIPSSMFRGMLSSELALLLGIGFASAAVWAALQNRRVGGRELEPKVRFGLIAAVVGLFANATAMFAAAFRISQLGY